MSFARPRPLTSSTPVPSKPGAGTGAPTSLSRNQSSIQKPKSVGPSSGFSGARRGPGTGPRGVTPPNSKKRTKNIEDQTEIGERPPHVPKLKLTVQQELDILDRLENDNWIPGAGWAQFLPEPQTEDKPKCHQNLFGAFNTASNEEMGSKFCSKSGFGELENMGYSRHLESTINSERTLLPEEDNNKTHYDDGKFIETFKDSMQLSQEDSDNSSNSDAVWGQKDDFELPDYLEKIDAILESHDDYKTLMERTIQAVFEARYEELFPQSEVRHVIKRLEEAIKVLEQFTNENSSESMKLFFPNPHSDEKITIRLPVEEQHAFTESLYNLSSILEKFEQYLSNEDSTDHNKKIEDKIQNFSEIVEKFGSDLEEGEKHSESVNELFKLLKSFCNRKSNDSGTSEDMLDLGDSD